MSNNLLVFNRGSYFLIGGTVTSVKKEAEGKVTTLTLSGAVYDRAAKSEVDSSVSINYWSSDDPEDQLSGKRQYAATAAKVRQGTYIATLAAPRKDGKGYNGYFLTWSGVVTAKGGDEYNVAGKTGRYTDAALIVGTVIKAVSTEKNTRLTVITGSGDSAAFQTVTVWNGGKGEAERAYRLFAPTETPSGKTYRKGVFYVGKNTHFGRPADDPEVGNSNSYSVKKFFGLNKTEEDEDGFLPIPDSVGDLPFEV